MTLDPRNFILEEKFAFLQPLKLEMIHRFMNQTVNDRIQITMFASQLMKPAQHTFPITQHRTSGILVQ